MCLYYMVADWGRQWIPNTVPPAPVWPKEMLDQFEDLLKRVKELEDKLGGCPCEEPEKLDYLKEIRKMIEGGNNTASTTFTVTPPTYTVTYDLNQPFVYQMPMPFTVVTRTTGDTNG